MCLITKQTKPTILTEDMTVYKELSHRDSCIYSKRLNFIWELGKLYQTTIEESTEHLFHDKYARLNVLSTFDESFVECYYENINRVELFHLYDVKCYGPGFHSFKSKSRACKDHKPTFLYECTIPAGSEIYEDNFELIVSNQIIINKLCV